jgi:hypothetical protein
VARRHLDGRHDLRGRHAAGGGGLRGEVRCGRQLALVERRVLGILTVFFFARLWRRAGVLTDVEFAELRYGGRPAAVLRGFRALYLALPINLIIMGWVTRAMVTILQITMHVNPWRAAILLFGITALYSVFSGLWGVIVTDAFQFVVAMGGSILLAVLAVGSVGGLDDAEGEGSGSFRLGRRRVRRASSGGTSLAAALDAPDLSRRPVVGRVVSGTGARRRGLRGAADPLGQGRAPRPSRNPLVHHRPLRAAAMALDPGRIRRTASDILTWPTRRRATSESWWTSCLRR